MQCKKTQPLRLQLRTTETDQQKKGETRMKKKNRHRKKSLEIFGCQFTDLLVYRRRYWFTDAFQHVAAVRHRNVPEGEKIGKIAKYLRCQHKCVAYKTTCCHCHISRPSMALCLGIVPIILLAIETKQKMRKLPRKPRSEKIHIKKGHGEK